MSGVQKFVLPIALATAIIVYAALAASEQLVELKSPPPPDPEDSEENPSHPSQPTEGQVQIPSAQPPQIMVQHGTDDWSGSGFVRRAAGLSDVERENLIIEFLARGAIPSSQRQFVPVSISENGKAVTFYVTPDVLTVGSDTDRFRPAITAKTAQRAANALGMYLPTQKMVRAIHQSADVKVPFKSFGSPRDSFARHVESNSAIERRIAGRSGLISGHSKDYVIGAPRSRHPQSIAIYGGWDAQDRMIQPPSGGVHYIGYRDYSQRARLIGNMVVADGVQRQLADILADPNYASLLHDGGPTTSLSYPT